MTVTVVVADDDAIVRRAVVALLESDQRFRVVAVADDGNGAVAAAEVHRPDLAIVDVRMPDGGAAAVEAIRRRSPGTTVMVLTSYDDHDVRRSMLEAGAHAFLVKGAEEDVLDAARRVMRLGAPSAD